MKQTLIGPAHLDARAARRAAARFPPVYPVGLPRHSGALRLGVSRCQVGDYCYRPGICCLRLAPRLFLHARLSRFLAAQASGATGAIIADYAHRPAGVPHHHRGGRSPPAIATTSAPAQVRRPSRSASAAMLKRYGKRRMEIMDVSPKTVSRPSPIPAAASRGRGRHAGRERDAATAVRGRQYSDFAGGTSFDAANTCPRWRVCRVFTRPPQQQPRSSR